MTERSIISWIDGSLLFSMFMYSAVSAESFSFFILLCCFSWPILLLLLTSKYRMISEKWWLTLPQRFSLHYSPEDRLLIIISQLVILISHSHKQTLLLNTNWNSLNLVHIEIVIILYWSVYTLIFQFCIALLIFLFFGKKFKQQITSS